MWTFLLLAAFLLFRAVRQGLTWAPRRPRWYLGWLGPVGALAGMGFLAATDFEVQKGVGHLLQPVGLLWLGLGLAAGLCWWKQQRLGGILLSVAWLALALAGNAWLSHLALSRLERGLTEIDPATAPTYDAVWVLGGGTCDSPSGRPQLSGSGERVMLPARLFHAGKTPLLVTSGSINVGAMHRQADHTAQTAAIWSGLGIPAQAIIQVPTPKNTKEEVAALTAMAQERGWTRLGLVTSAWHLPRALLHARQCGVTVMPIPAGFDSEPAPGLSGVWVIPNARALGHLSTAWWEVLGRLR